ncbi:MAG: hypothetical protein GY753_03740 [Gammaproteobacteria bacterium]|nr:hypothetical protein [Gammaproteobacteria bacterium]
MKTLTKAIALALMAGAVTAFSLQAGEIPERGPIPFSTYDSDGNGSITPQEFNQVQSLRRDARATTGRPMRNAPNAPSFAEFDADGDCKLSPQELTAGQQANMQKRRTVRGAAMGSGRGMGRRAGKGPGRGMGRNMPTFSDFDLNSDGVLVEDEFIEARGRRVSERAKQGYQMRGLSNMLQFSDIDSDGNDKVTPNEFAAGQALHRQQKFQ